MYAYMPVAHMHSITGNTVELVHSADITFGDLTVNTD